jgi:hypothetical protein
VPSRRALTLAVAIPLGVLLGAGSPLTRRDTSTEALASEIRDHGYPCKKPDAGIRDPARSTPEAAVWLLRCDGVGYRLLLVPGRPTVVEPVKT